MKSKILTGILAVVLVIFLIYQIFASLYNPVTTEIVTKYEYTDGVNITAVIIRDEMLVENNHSGTLHFEINDSERAPKDGIIANVFGTAEQSYAATEIVKIKNEIKNIQEIESYNDLNAVDIDLINNKMYESLNAIIRRSQLGSYSDISEYKESLLSLINRKQIATGVAVDFTSQLNELNSRLAVLEAQLGTPLGSVRAEKAGYFISATDGYEAVLKPDKISEITPEFLENLKPQPTDNKSVIGKLVSDYTWYIAANVSINDSLQFKVGDNLKILTGMSAFPEITVTVDRINMSVSEDKAVVIFACNQMNSELSAIRSATMTVVKNHYSGLKVSSKALRFKDEGENAGSPVTGVYVVTGMTANFVPVEIVHSTEGFAICKVKYESGNLKLYDEIIVKGKNIYDGKIID